jgi:hypothetical protein
MQKTLDILEKNVQWIVLSLAALFLVWAAYAYLLTPPATVKIGNHLVTPGEVSLEVQNTAKGLDRQIKENKPVTFPTPDLVTDWQHHITNPFATQLAVNYSGSLPDMGGTVKEGPGGPTGPYIAQLPSAPAPDLLPTMVGLSTVDPTTPNAPQNAAPIGGAQQVAQPQSKDTAWVTVPAVLKAAAFKKAMLAPFKGAPPNPALDPLYNTTILQVVLERQQSNGVDANGAPTFPANVQGTVTEIGPLTADKSFVQRLPDPSATTDAGYQFIQWAQENQQLVASPSFYRGEKGDVWQAPQLPVSDANGGQPAPGVEPGVPAPATEPNATPPAQAPTPTPPPNAAGMKYPDASYAPFDPARPRGQFPFGGNGRFIPPPPGAAGNGNANGNGIINLFNLTTDILIWANDETAAPGQTYRYRVKYVIKNPIFAEENMGPKNLIDQLAIHSAASTWSEPVKVPSMTKFWVASTPQRDYAPFDVFQYKDGDWKATKPKLGPGDEIPGTDLTMVDVRSNETNHQQKYVLLTTNTGEMLRRDVDKDTSDPDHAAMVNPNGPNGVNGPNGMNPPPNPANPRGNFRRGGMRPPNLPPQPGR